MLLDMVFIFVPLLCASPNLMFWINFNSDQNKGIHCALRKTGSLLDSSHFFAQAFIGWMILLRVRRFPYRQSRQADLRLKFHFLFLFLNLGNVKATLSCW
jgi:hypothetical protein